MKDKEFAMMIESKMNNCNCDYSGITHELSRIHRTLQQNFTKMCIAWLQQLSNLNKTQYDERNMASVDFAKKIKNELQDAHLPMI